MKRRLFLLLVVVAVTLNGMAQTVGEAFYIYRNDGGFNAFFRNEVISMEYSYEDAEGKTYDEVVTQIINTADSVYKIPLAAIDSIGFVTPETQYMPGVKLIEGDLREYVLSSDELQIVFSAQTPSDLLPQIGDKLVTLEQNDIFPIGFMGEVISVTTTVDGNYCVGCEAVSITDIFKCYYGVINSTYSESRLNFPQRRAVHGTGQVTFTPPPFRYGLTDEWTLAIDLDDDYAFTFQPNFMFELAPTFQVSAFLIRPDHEDNELYISLSCIADFHFVEHIGATGGLEWSHDWGWTDPVTHLPRLSWPIPDCPLVRFYIEPGVFLRASSKISSQLEFTQDYQLIFHYDVSSRYGQSMKPNFKPRRIGSSFDGEISMDGSIAIGGYAEMGFLLADKDFAHICFRGELGFEGESDAVLLKTETSTAKETTEIYDRLHNTAIDFNWFSGTSIKGRVWPFEVSHDNPPTKDPIASLGHVPSFSDVSLEAISLGAVEAEASIDLDGRFSRLLRPVRVGFALHDEDGNTVDTYYDENEYQSGLRYISHIFNNLKEGGEYTVYPIVDYNGLEMLAKPFAEVDTPNFPVIITDVEQTGSEYKKDAFTNCGKQYSYKFNCAVTVVLTNNTNVEDWGYIYESPEGSTTRISLISQNSSYTDTHSFYYRNESSSTIRLYEYVKYKGDSKYYYGEPKEYTISHKENSVEVITGGYDITGLSNIRLFGNIVGDDLDNNLEYGICYTLQTSPNDWNHVPATNLRDHSFSVYLKDLKEGTEYIYRAYVKLNEDKYLYGEEKTFTTRNFSGTANYNLTITKVTGDNIEFNFSFDELESGCLFAIKKFVRNGNDIIDTNYGLYLSYSGPYWFNELEPATTYYLQVVVLERGSYRILKEFDKIEVTTLPLYSFNYNILGGGSVQSNLWFIGYLDMRISCTIQGQYNENDGFYTWDWSGIELVGIYYNSTGDPQSYNSTFMRCKYNYDPTTYGNFVRFKSDNHLEKINKKDKYYIRGVFKIRGETYLGKVLSVSFDQFQDKNFRDQLSLNYYSDDF